MITRQHGNVYITCPLCNSTHVFIPVAYGEYELYSVEIDEYKRTFENDRFKLNGNMLIPIFVCRNLKCDFECNIKL